jgi:hypothetical protein
MCQAVVYVNDEEHADELRSWADSIQHSGKVDVAIRLFAAAASLQNAGDHLSKLLEEACGIVPF